MLTHHPGGGVGIFNGCTTEWGAPSSGWGAQYGGISSETECAAFPSALQPGCDWRFDWFGGSDNPTVDFEQVACPAEILAKTGSKRTDDSSMPDVVGAVSGGASTSKAAASSSVAPVVAAASSSTPAASSYVAPAVSSSSSSQAAASSSAPIEAVSTPSSTPAAAVSTIKASSSAPPANTLATVYKTLSKSACSASASASAVSGAVAAAKYAQCGGSGWTGPTACVEGATCTVQNTYYSQCV